MVCNPAPAGTDVSNRGIGRGRMFLGGLILFAAVIAWATTLMMSPHGQSGAPGAEHVRTTVVIFVEQRRRDARDVRARGMVIISGETAAGAATRLGDPRHHRADGADQSLPVDVAAVGRSVI